MGADFFLNPPRERCKKCAVSVIEGDLYDDELCANCYIKKLKRRIRKLENVLDT
jgi:hypothetical protein